MNKDHFVKPRVSYRGLSETNPLIGGIVNRVETLPAHQNQRPSNKIIRRDYAQESETVDELKAHTRITAKALYYQVDAVLVAANVGV